MLLRSVISYKNWYLSDEERDEAMTNNSDIDIAIPRREGSGTWKNLQRRISKNKLRSVWLIIREL